MMVGKKYYTHCTSNFQLLKAEYVKQNNLKKLYLTNSIIDALLVVLHIYIKKKKTIQVQGVSQQVFFF